MGLLQEWRGFASFAVEYLGMPENAMPLYEKSKVYSKKAVKICHIIMKTGNMGHNINQSYRLKYPKLRVKFITFGRRLKEFAGLASIFPSNSPRFFFTYVFGKTDTIL